MFLFMLVMRLREILPLQTWRDNSSDFGEGTTYERATSVVVHDSRAFVSTHQGIAILSRNASSGQLAFLEFVANGDVHRGGILQLLSFLV